MAMERSLLGVTATVRSGASFPSPALGWETDAGGGLADCPWVFSCLRARSAGALLVNSPRRGCEGLGFLEICSCAFLLPHLVCTRCPRYPMYQTSKEDPREYSLYLCVMKRSLSKVVF